MPDEHQVLAGQPADADRGVVVRCEAVGLVDLGAEGFGQIYAVWRARVLPECTTRDPNPSTGRAVSDPNCAVLIRPAVRHLDRGRGSRQTIYCFRR